jgi:hypothetical protein
MLLDVLLCLEPVSDSLWGIGCSLAIMYSLYLTAYRKAVKDSLKAVKPKRYTRVLETILAKKAKAAAQTPPQ